MDLTFIGHQSWMIGYQDTHLLLDPVLGNAFGHSKNIEFRVYPPREVDTEKMPPIAGVILSHEHLDHFHLPSLNLLPRNTPFYVSVIMPECVIAAIEKLGFTVHVLPFKETITINDLSFTLYQAGEDTVFWEQRVSQVLVETPETSTFIAVDALISESYKTDVAEEKVRIPDAVVLANNSQIPPPGATGAYSNLLPIPDNEKYNKAFPGIQVLNSVLIQFMEDMPPVRNMILCGNGFINLADEFGPFLCSDNKNLARIANELALDAHAFGPYPGDSVSLCGPAAEEGGCSWIQRDAAQHRRLIEKTETYMAQPRETPFTPLIAEPFSKAEEAAAVSELERELTWLAPHLLRSKTALQAINCEEYLGQTLGPQRMLFRFLGAHGTHYNYAMDFRKGRFERTDVDESDKLFRFPYGVETHLIDFIEVMRGDLQIWDLAGNAMRSWFVGSIYENLVVFLFEVYGEQTRGDLAEKVYNRAIAKLQPEKALV